jgi:hypothetical protein
MAGDSLEQPGSVALDAVPNRLAQQPGGLARARRRSAAPIVGEAACGQCRA